MESDGQPPVLIEDDNLSRAWARIFLQVIDNPGTRLGPLVVSVTGFTEGQPRENATVRAALDACLAANGKHDIDTVAWTIFPQSVWRLARYERHRLYTLYKDAVPRYRAMNRSQNGRGLYFERLIAFGSGPMEGNQLEWIISNYRARSSVRRTMLQASIFDPARDHIPQAQLGFPCLQHVTFVPIEGILHLNAFYATQQLFDKAYGNWLGLCHLGQFMAQEMGLRFGRFNCFIGIEKLERISKRAPSLQPVIDAARACGTSAFELSLGTSQ